MAAIYAGWRGDGRGKRAAVGFPPAIPQSGRGFDPMIFGQPNAFKSEGRPAIWPPSTSRLRLAVNIKLGRPRPRAGLHLQPRIVCKNAWYNRNLADTTLARIAGFS